MAERSGIAVTMVGGATRNFLPGPNHPGVTHYNAAPEATGMWLVVYACGPGPDAGRAVARFSQANVLYQEWLE